MSHSKPPGDENAETQSKTEHSQKEAGQSTGKKPGPQEDPRSAGQGRAQTRCRRKSCSGEITRVNGTDRQDRYELRSNTLRSLADYAITAVCPGLPSVKIFYWDNWSCPHEKDNDEMDCDYCPDQRTLAGLLPGPGSSG